MPAGFNVNLTRRWFVRLGSLIASNIYRDDDKPYYHRGNKVLLALSIVNLFLFAFAKVWYIKRNAAKAKIWNAMSPEEKDTYLATTTDAGNKRSACCCIVWHCLVSYRLFTIC